MATAQHSQRAGSYGQHRAPTSVDRFGVWLSTRQIRHSVPDFAGRRVGDFGCGFDATFARTVLDAAEQVVLVDVALADDLKEHPKVVAIEGSLPEALEPEQHYLAAIAADVRKLIKDGKTLEDATKIAGFSERDAWKLFDQYHVRNVTAAFAELEWE